VSLLRESFAGINGRFHLAGLYTLAALLFTLVLDMAGPPDKIGEEWSGLIFSLLIVFHAAVCGIYGSVYQAAAGRSQPLSFMGYAASLFLPFLWLFFKISIIVYGLASIAALGYHQLAGGAAPLERSLTTVFFWAGPLIALAIQTLSLYSVPLCIVSRERGERSAPIVEGWRFFRACPAESRRLMLILVLIAALGGAVQYARGPERQEGVPDIPEALILFAKSYLELVALFGATRVVLARLGLPQGRDLRADPAATAGPPA
jgi:hypothetical protein